MNREIIFRGKRVDNGEWVEGHYSNLYTKSGNSLLLTHYIMLQIAGRGMENFRVEKDSVGQFTGLTDRNGVKIWEGDVVNVLSTSWEYEVKFQKGCFKLVHIGKNAGLGVWGAIYRIEEKGFEIEVIGTIHDTHLTQQS